MGIHCLLAITFVLLCTWIRTTQVSKDLQHRLCVNSTVAHCQLEREESGIRQNITKVAEVVDISYIAIMI